MIVVLETLSGLEDADPIALLGESKRADGPAETGSDDEDVVGGRAGEVRFHECTVRRVAGPAREDGLRGRSEKHTRGRHIPPGVS